MMQFMHALRGRRRALRRSRAARRCLADATGDLIEVYQAHPVPTLAGAAGLGLVLAQLHTGHRMVRAGIRIASGPGWRLVRQYLSI